MHNTISDYSIFLLPCSALGNENLHSTHTSISIVCVYVCLCTCIYLFHGIPKNVFYAIEKAFKNNSNCYRIIS